ANLNGGTVGDLATAQLHDAAGTALDTEYYRYYTGGSNGCPHLLKYVFGAESFGRLRRDFSNDPTGAPDAAVAPYADRSLAYDSSGRGSTADVQGDGSATSNGPGTHTTFSYTARAPSADYNSRAGRAAEGLPDGTQNIVYTNSFGEVMLRDFRDAAGRDWLT